MRKVLRRPRPEAAPIGLDALSCLQGLMACIWMSGMAFDVLQVDAGWHRTLPSAEEAPCGGWAASSRFC